ncbi:MAG: hypothetical protein ACI8T1_001389 [Verrucomicrobiales bacterium]|jgi:hypothetical protein
MAVGVDSIKDARAAAIADFDNDGDVDIVVGCNPGINPSITPVLYRNDLGNRQNWIEVDLTGTSVNKDAVGSEVRIELPDGSRQLRHVMTGSAYASQSGPRLYFGIGKFSNISKLTVDWKGPGAGQQVFENVSANQRVKIVQGQTIELTGVQ